MFPEYFLPIFDGRPHPNQTFQVTEGDFEVTEGVFQVTEGDFEVRI